MTRASGLDLRGDLTPEARSDDVAVNIRIIAALHSRACSGHDRLRRIGPEERYDSRQDVVDGESIIDSWSDDETADFLMIGPRQVQRCAGQGKFYYILVHRKRRYPVWQFDRACGVLDGAAIVGQALP